MAKQATRCSIGLQDNCEDLHRGNSIGETPFKLAYGSEAIIFAEVHMANHRVMKYQNEENEEQLHLNLDLIDEVRMDAKQRTARYKSLMVR